MKDYPVFRKTMAAELLLQGFDLINVQQNNKDDRFYVYYFKNSEELQMYLTANYSPTKK